MYIYFYAPFPPKVLDRSILDKIKLIIEMECFEQINGNDERLQVSYVNKSEKFVRRNQEFNRQFAHIYSSRLGKLSNLLASKVEQKWGTQYPIKKLHELREDNPEKCVIIGTFYKHQELKPSILREISEENQLAPPPSRSHYTDDSDILILEDEIQRIRLIGKIEVNQQVTGIVSAVLGYEEGDGRFAIEDYIFYEAGPETPLKVIDSSPHIVFISGLDLSHTEKISNSLQMFKEWIYGNWDFKTDFAPSNIVRVVIAGNSISSMLQKQMKNTQTSLAKNFDTSDMMESMIVLDQFISQLTESLDVDLMPGEFDPSNCMLPQLPLHYCMFPESGNKKTFQGVSNPYQCEMEGRLILGTSGQNIQDITRFSDITDPLEALKRSLCWSHIAPTCPDTLPCYPYYNEDPFIIENCPHVYFAGNMPEFRTELYKSPNKQNVRLIAIPAFNKTQEVAILNLKTLECSSLGFNLDFNDEEE